MIKRIVAALALLVLTASSCESDETTSTTDDTTAASADAEVSADESAAGADEQESSTTEPPDFEGDDDGDFCTLAREFEENDPLADASFFDGEEFFDRMDEVYGRVMPVAPAEIKPDFQITLDFVEEMRRILEPDYNVFDPAVAEAMENIDDSELEAADARISAYLLDVCGIERAVPQPGDSSSLPDPSDLENIDPEQADAILEALGVSPELAECLNRELGDDFDFTNPDPSFLTQEVCGTTIVEILSGIGQSG